MNSGKIISKLLNYPPIKFIKMSEKQDYIIVITYKNEIYIESPSKKGNRKLISGIGIDLNQIDLTSEIEKTKGKKKIIIFKR
jgi:hypothetical protein